MLQTAPATEAARRWEGWGTALKPAAEYWTVARKPLEGTVAANVLRHGTGALNVDECRTESRRRPLTLGDGESKYKGWGTIAGSRNAGETNLGRWPPNFVMSHAPDCGEECAPSCPVAQMDRQSGERTSGKMLPMVPKGERQIYDKDAKGGYITTETYGDSGGASRFFPCFRYEAKPSRSERDAGLADLPRKTGGELTERKDGSAGLNSPRAGAGRTSGGRNRHPTVKSIALMRWLVRLVTPPGGLVLDPFTGSGSTGCAAVAEGFRFVGIEKDPESVDIARRRIEHWAGMGHQMDLFGGG